MRAIFDVTWAKGKPTANISTALNYYCGGCWNVGESESDPASGKQQVVITADFTVIKTLKNTTGFTFVEYKESNEPNFFKNYFQGVEYPVLFHFMSRNDNINAYAEPRTAIARLYDAIVFHKARAYPGTGSTTGDMFCELGACVDQAAIMKALNPNIKCFQYHNLTDVMANQYNAEAMVRPSEGIDYQFKSSGQNCWSYAGSDMYAIGAASNRFLFDVTNPDWRTYHINRLVDILSEDLIDGVCIDNVWLTNWMNDGLHVMVRQDETAITAGELSSLMVGWEQIMAGVVAAVGKDKLILGNGTPSSVYPSRSTPVSENRLSYDVNDLAATKVLYDTWLSEYNTAQKLNQSYATLSYKTAAEFELNQMPFLLLFDCMISRTLDGGVLAYQNYIDTNVYNYLEKLGKIGFPTTSAYFYQSVLRRDFTKGTTLFNYSLNPISITGLNHISLDGATVTGATIQPFCGLVLKTQ